MSKELDKMKRMIAKRVGYKMGLKTRVPAKAGSAALIKAKIDKKKIPYVPSPASKNADYAGLSQEAFEKRYSWE